jgi:hypothetical protein
VVIVSASSAGFRLQWSELVCIRLDEGTDDNAYNEYG